MRGIQNPDSCILYKSKPKGMERKGLKQKKVSTKMLLLSLGPNGTNNVPVSVGDTLIVTRRDETWTLKIDHIFTKGSLRVVWNGPGIVKPESVTWDLSRSKKFNCFAYDWYDNINRNFKVTIPLANLNMIKFLREVDEL